MLVAKLPGSMYATDAITAGPTNGRRALKPLRCPLSASRAASSVRCVAPAIGAAFACSSLNSVSIVNTLFISMHPAGCTPYEAPAYAAGRLMCNGGSARRSTRSSPRTSAPGRSDRHHIGPGLREHRENFRGDVEMLHHHSRWRMRQPVGQRNFGIVIGLEDLEEHEIGVADVLDVVAEALLYIADVARAEIVGECSRTRIEYGHSGLTLDVVLPFVGVGVPVELAHAARLDGDERSRNSRGGLEVPAVGDLHHAARGLAHRRQAAHGEDERMRGCAERRSHRLLGVSEWTGIAALENPEVVDRSV